MFLTSLFRRRSMPVKLIIFLLCCLFLTSNACQQQKAGPHAGVAAPLPSAFSSPSDVHKDSESSATANQQDEESKPEQASDTSGPCALLKSEDVQSVQG